jgi:predicted nucleic acid-binding Zn ribbon protein
MLPITFCAICGVMIPNNRHICEDCEKKHEQQKRKRLEEWRKKIERYSLEEK